MMLGVGKGLGKGKERVDWARDWCLLLLIFFAREDFTTSSCSQGFPKEDLALHFLLLFVVSHLIRRFPVHGGRGGAGTGPNLGLKDRKGFR